VKFFSELRNIFQSADIVIAERLDTAEASFSITYNEIPTVDAIQNILNLIPQRDTIVLTLANDSGDVTSFNNHQTAPIDFLDLTDGMLSEDNIDVRIQIDKTVNKGRLSIYDYEAFVSDLLPRQLPEVMGWFSSHLTGLESLLFEVFDYDVSFATRTMAFESSENAAFKPMVSRTQRLTDCKETACFYNMNAFEVVPDDFIIQGIVSANARLQPLFESMATVLSLAYVSSSSSIEDGKLKLQISGQRTVNYDLKLTDINEDDKWQNIYTWIYTDGNPTDKALIAHNVISLHCKFEAILNLDGAVFDAIKTNYNLYLRSNVNKYLDMKRDIAKFIQDVVSQVGEYAVAILGKFKANLLAILGFIFTVVLTRIGSTQKWDDIFTKHTIYLMEVFLIGSLIYLVICVFETKFKLKKTRNGYLALKENYNDILSEAELNEAFKNDKLFTDTEKTAKRGMVIWSLAWGILLVLAGVVIECLTVNHGLIVWLWNKLF
jgi:hypothetical protein